MNAPSAPSPADRDATRLRKLEEHAAFLEHTVEQLSGEIAEMNQRLSKMARRLDEMEALARRDEGPGVQPT